MTVTDVATLLHLHRITIYRLIAIGKLRPFKIGRVWRFDRNDVVALSETKQRPKKAIQMPVCEFECEQHGRFKRSRRTRWSPVAPYAVAKCPVCRTSRRTPNQNRHSSPEIRFKLRPVSLSGPVDISVARSHCRSEHCGKLPYGDRGPPVLKLRRGRGLEAHTTSGPCIPLLAL